MVVYLRPLGISKEFPPSRHHGNAKQKRAPYTHTSSTDRYLIAKAAQEHKNLGPVGLETLLARHGEVKVNDAKQIDNIRQAQKQAQFEKDRLDQYILQRPDVVRLHSTLEYNYIVFRTDDAMYMSKIHPMLYIDTSFNMGTSYGTAIVIKNNDFHDGPIQLCFYYLHQVIFLKLKY
jgi:hypothetical protein